MQTLDSYRALALQITCRAVARLRTADEARAAMASTLARLAEMLPPCLGFLGSSTKLVVLPEYFLTGFPLGQSFGDWIKLACLRADGPEYEDLGSLAQANRVYLAGNAYEVDTHWPDLYFQTCFIVDPSGNVCLRYRRINSMFAVTPHDIWDAYLDVYGLEGVFPVARTELGALAAIASEEILYPEVARCHAMRGAQVFVHCTSDMAGAGPPQAVKDAAKITRAVENMAYVVSANSASIEGLPIPAQSANGGSKIVDFRGQVIATASTGETIAANAELDMVALRRCRAEPGMANILSRQRFEAYAASYAAHSFYPANTIGAAAPDRSHFLATQQRVIERLSELGLL